MTLILDTCVFLWLTGRSSNLSIKAIVAINDPANDLCLSATTLWEICIKFRIGKLPLPEAPRIWLPKQMSHFQIHQIDIEDQDIFLSGELPGAHTDPFDRLIAAQAINRHFPILTSDIQFKKLGAKVIW